MDTSNVPENYESYDESTTVVLPATRGERGRIRGRPNDDEVTRLYMLQLPPVIVNGAIYEDFALRNFVRRMGWLVIRPAYLDDAVPRGQPRIRVYVRCNVCVIDGVRSLYEHEAIQEMVERGFEVLKEKPTYAPQTVLHLYFSGKLWYITGVNGFVYNISSTIMNNPQVTTYRELLQLFRSFDRKDMSLERVNDDDVQRRRERDRQDGMKAWREWASHQRRQ